MTASQEERAYRSSNKKCIKGEARNILLEGLIRKKIGLQQVEEYVLKERKKFQGGGDRNEKKIKMKRRGEVFSGQYNENEIEG